MSRRKIFIAFLIVFTVFLVSGTAILLSRHSAVVLHPQGQIAQKQQQIILFAAFLSLVVVIPVYVMTFMIAWKYRATNPNNPKYTPNWDSNKFIETIWWGVPIVLILVLSVVTVKTSHELDPFKPLASEKKPVRVQVVAMQWKWLFIYPEQKIATVNYLQIPENTPINFEITSDAPMNSFWIPKLGGQVYAMSGMSTQLHLMSSGKGSFEGVSANISGAGFADMKFKVDATSQADFDNWSESLSYGKTILNHKIYHELSLPKTEKESLSFALKDDLEDGDDTSSNLYHHILMHNMDPSNSNINENEHEAHR